MIEVARMSKTGVIKLYFLNSCDTGNAVLKQSISLYIAFTAFHHEGRTKIFQEMCSNHSINQYGSYKDSPSAHWGWPLPVGWMY